jgi:hypothetical protein
VSFGVKFILIVHFLASVRLVFKGWFAIMDDATIMNYTATDMIKSVLLSGYALAGIPIILMAFWGAIQRVETLVRVYCWFVALSILVDLVWIASNLMVDPCSKMPAELGNLGAAYMCGAARVFDSVLMFAAVGVQMYLLHVVWSYCEDLAETGGWEIGDLGRDVLGRPISQMALRRKNMEESDPYITLPGHHDGQQQEGLRTCCPCFGAALEQLGCDMFCGGLIAMTGFGTNPEYSSTYSNFSSGVGTSVRLFDGRFHELQYPPPHKPHGAAI